MLNACVSVVLRTGETKLLIPNSLQQIDDDRVVLFAQLSEGSPVEEFNLEDFRSVELKRLMRVPEELALEPSFVDSRSFRVQENSQSASAKLFSIEDEEEANLLADRKKEAPLRAKQSEEVKKAEAAKLAKKTAKASRRKKRNFTPLYVIGGVFGTIVLAGTVGAIFEDGIKVPSIISEAGSSDSDKWYKETKTRDFATGMEQDLPMSGYSHSMTDNDYVSWRKPLDSYEEALENGNEKSGMPKGWVSDYIFPNEEKIAGVVRSKSDTIVENSSTILWSDGKCHIYTTEGVKSKSYIKSKSISSDEEFSNEIMKELWLKSLISTPEKLEEAKVYKYSSRETVSFLEERSGDKVFAVRGFADNGRFYTLNNTCGLTYAEMLERGITYELYAYPIPIDERNPVQPES